MSNYWATREVMTFDVDKFIADVCEKYKQMAQENAALAAWAKTEEELRKLWDAVLNDRRPGGDASLYPNQHGPQPALMEVWHKAGDFWRAKYRLGDTLLCDQNGAALNPMELGLIEKAKAEPKTIQASEAANVAPDLKHLCNDGANDAAPAAAGALDSARGQVPGRKQTSANEPARDLSPGIIDGPKDIEAVGNQSTTDPISNTTLSYHSGDDPEPTAFPNFAPKPKPQQLELFEEEEEESAGRKMMRSAGYLAAATLAIVIVWQTGLIIPLGLIGLGASGLLR